MITYKIQIHSLPHCFEQHRVMLFVTAVNETQAVRCALLKLKERNNKNYATTSWKIEKIEICN